MSIISTSDFINSLTIPTPDEVNLQGFIDEYESKGLKEILGYSLNKDFQAGLSESSVPQKWIDLRDGVEFVYNSETKYFVGAKEMILRYVYFFVLRNIQSYVTDSGVKVAQTENSTFGNSANKQAPAWNYMSNENILLNEFITATNTDTADTYENYTFNDMGKINVLGI